MTGGRDHCHHSKERGCHIWMYLLIVNSVQASSGSVVKTAKQWTREFIERKSVRFQGKPFMYRLAVLPKSYNT